MYGTKMDNDEQNTPPEKKWNNKIFITGCNIVAGNTKLINPLVRGDFFYFFK